MPLIHLRPSWSNRGKNEETLACHFSLLPKPHWNAKTTLGCDSHFGARAIHGKVAFYPPVRQCLRLSRAVGRGTAREAEQPAETRDKENCSASSAHWRINSMSPGSGLPVFFAMLVPVERRSNHPCTQHAGERSAYQARGNVTVEA